MKDQYSTSIQLMHNIYPHKNINTHLFILFDYHRNSNIDFLVIGCDMTWELTKKDMIIAKCTHPS